jgi:hypothetical protein
MQSQFMQKLNWPIWAGFLLSLVAGLSYPFLFARCRLLVSFHGRI